MSRRPNPKMMHSYFLSQKVASCAAASCWQVYLIGRYNTVDVLGNSLNSARQVCFEYLISLRFLSRAPINNVTVSGDVVVWNNRLHWRVRGRRWSPIWKDRCVPEWTHQQVRRHFAPLRCCSSGLRELAFFTATVASVRVRKMFILHESSPPLRNQDSIASRIVCPITRVNYQ